MAADLQAIPLRPHMVRVMDRPAGQPENAPLEIAENRQAFIRRKLAGTAWDTFDVTARRHVEILILIPAPNLRGEKFRLRVRGSVRNANADTIVVPRLTNQSLPARKALAAACRAGVALP